MEALYIMYGIMAWLALGVVGFGFFHAFFKRRWPSLSEPSFTDAWIIWFGPIAIAVALATLIKENGWRKAFKYGFLL